MYLNYAFDGCFVLVILESWGDYEGVVYIFVNREVPKYPQGILGYHPGWCNSAEVVAYLISKMLTVDKYTSSCERRTCVCGRHMWVLGLLLYFVQYVSLDSFCWDDNGRRWNAARSLDWWSIHLKIWILLKSKLLVQWFNMLFDGTICAPSFDYSILADWKDVSYTWPVPTSLTTTSIT